jgi:hypothetical protein
MMVEFEDDTTAVQHSVVARGTRSFLKLAGKPRETRL